MSKAIAAGRQQQIMELLASHSSVKIIDLAEKFHVSKETIRRDLNFLEEKGLLQKSYGGAITAKQYEFNTVSLESRMGKNQEIKTLLCQRAMSLLPEQAVVFLDSGSTILCMAELFNQKSGYTILTNSLSAANVLINGRNRTILTGGQLNAETMATDGLQTVEFLSRVKVDVAFLGTNGFEQHMGPSGTDFSDLQTKQTVLKNAKTSIVVSESRKATYSGLMQYASWRDIDHFVTDSNLPEAMRETLQDMTDLVFVEV